MLKTDDFRQTFICHFPGRFSSFSFQTLVRVLYFSPFFLLFPPSLVLFLLLVKLADFVAVLKLSKVVFLIIKIYSLSLFPKPFVYQTSFTISNGFWKRAFGFVFFTLATTMRQNGSKTAEMPQIAVDQNIL